MYHPDFIHHTSADIIVVLKGCNCWWWGIDRPYPAMAIGGEWLRCGKLQISLSIVMFFYELIIQKKCLIGINWDIIGMVNS